MIEKAPLVKSKFVPNTTFRDKQEQRDADHLWYLQQLEEVHKAGIREVVEAVLAIMETPKQTGHRLKEITEYCKAQLDTTTSAVLYRIAERKEKLNESET
mgnify:FL=1